MSFKLFLIPAAIVSILYGLAMASVASAEHTVTATPFWETECALVDDMVECDIESAYGISNVLVTLESGIGDIIVLDQDYKGCPTEVHVSLDPIVIDEASNMQVTTCFEWEPEGEGAIVCISGECPGDEPGVGVSRPDPLPLKVVEVEPVRPIGAADSFVATR